MIEVGAEPFLGLIALEELIDKCLKVLSDHGAIMDDVLGLYKVEAVMKRCRGELHAHLISNLIKRHKIRSVKVLHRHSEAHVGMLKLDELLECRVAALVAIRDAPDSVIGLLKPLDGDADTDLGKFLTQVNDSVGKETVGGNHDAVGLLVKFTHDIFEISANERLATSDVGEIHLRKLLDGLEGNLLVGTTGSLVSVAHGATSVAAIRNDDRAVEFLFCHEV